MHANDVRSTEAIRHGAYVCLNVPAGEFAAVAGAAVPALADHLELRSEFEPGNPDPPRAIAYLRRVGASAGDVADHELLRAGAVVHVAAATPEPVEEFRAGLTRQPGSVMPNAFLVPIRKSDAWWRKGWMERHTYFLPRYDESGGMVSKGHALAAAPGIKCLMRRTYWNAAEPALPGEYDFVSYFECADSDVPVFHQVRGALRDTTRNPEWKFVSEGPTWHGRRVATWAELFA
jgi:hypothetical protein